MAQSTFGSFVGTVHDPSGGVLPETVVSLTNVGTAAVRSALTDSGGNYVLVNIEPGIYRLRMEAPGFQSQNFADVQLLARRPCAWTATMSVATQTESVNVTATLEPVITTETSSIAETKTGRELLELPIAIGSRAAGSTSPISTLTTQPGVQVDNSGALMVAETSQACYRSPSTASAR
ncbi:MAG: carboxypeptidase-like regulatory domain-containing protein [Acidobacteriota bacterium]